MEDIEEGIKMEGEDLDLYSGAQKQVAQLVKEHCGSPEKTQDTRH